MAAKWVSKVQWLKQDKVHVFFHVFVQKLVMRNQWDSTSIFTHGSLTASKGTQSCLAVSQPMKGKGHGGSAYPSNCFKGEISRL